jgi:hypothetical protein
MCETDFPKEHKFHTLKVTCNYNVISPSDFLNIISEENSIISPKWTNHYKSIGEPVLIGVG